MTNPSEIRANGEPASPNPPSDPVVSVVIASVNGLPYPLSCLQALQTQETDIPIEVLVADCTGPSTVAAIRERFPSTRILTFDTPTSVPALRAAGIAVARGRLVAVTEDHCVPRPDWIQRIVEVHERTGWAAVGGGVVNGSTERTVDWAVYFCEYGHMMSPVPAGPSEVIPGMNVAYDFDQLEAMRDVFAEGMWENFLHDRLRAAGYTMGLDPSIVVAHDKYFTVPMFLFERYHLSRAFAGGRVAGSSLPVRLAWAAASTALPGLLVLRAVRNVWRRRAYRRRFLLAFPLVVLFSVAWSIGEFVGYLTGPGDSLVKIR
jgi:GT2 family glycosyltransferase